ncbi:MAG: type IV toxin-antitoxin system AbiEi family antitoxin [Bacteroidota bacterium]
MIPAPITEHELPWLIVDRLAKETELSLAYRELASPVGNAHVDGVLELKDQSTLWVEVKRAIRKSQVKRILGQVQRLRTLLPENKANQPFVLLTSYLSQQQREYLRQSRLYYADLAGNAYLRLNGNLIWIEGRSKASIPAIQEASFFTPSSMKLVFAYLLRPSLIQRPYREQAEWSGVAKSTLGDIIKKLVQADYLIQESGKALSWQNLDKLANDWIMAYPRVLKPQLSLVKLKFPHQELYRNWERTWPGSPKLQWGGEPAGALLTGHLSPGIYTLYSQVKTVEVLKILKAIPDPEGPIEVLKVFWPSQLSADPDVTHVPPLLAFADLVNTQDVRNLQTAHRIHERYLSYLFTETGFGTLPNAF